ncbi:response regulator transcription factor [Ectobacillus sp. sgz5001026]|uniref:response regulator transcription factor n=1 Tax=Ectobacillus sp. sgz5001026 TaxID=3242473 RepID=UPI0036D2DF2B
MTTICIIEDDSSLRELLTMMLNKEGYEVVSFPDGSQVVEYCLSIVPDLVILDWMLPVKDGMTILKEIRKTSDMPVLVLTAKDTEQDQLTGFLYGADDYVTKPFSSQTLLARVRAILRRTSHQKIKDTEEETIIQGAHFFIQVDAHTVFIYNEAVKDLTPKEFELLVFFAKRPNHVFSREQLLEQIWGYDFYGDVRTVDAHIKRLRRKMGNVASNWIQTVWGVGYKFDETT